MMERTLVITVAFMSMVKFACSENVDLDRVLLDRFNSMEMEIERLAQRVNDLETNDEIKSKQIHQLECQVQLLTKQNAGLEIQHEESRKTIHNLEAIVEHMTRNSGMNGMGQTDDFITNSSFQTNSMRNAPVDGLRSDTGDDSYNARKPGRQAMETPWTSMQRTLNDRALSDTGPRVAFNAFIVSGDYGPVGVGQSIVFGRVLTNVGNAFHSHNGVFVVPVDGVYVLSITMAAKKQTHTFSYVHVKVNNNDIGVLQFHDTDQSTQVFIVNLHQNDDVYAVSGYSGDVLLGTFSSFSGFLLYPSNSENIAVG